MIKHKILFKAIVGSQSYGTAIPTSDIDHKGVYIQTPREILGFDYVEQIDVTKDECYFEVRRFLSLLKTANPTVLELLYSPADCVVEKHPAFDLIIKHRDKFLTKKCLNSFAGYAIAQIHKARGLDKKMNWERERTERKTPFDFCYIYENGKTFPLGKFLAEHNMKQEDCGLIRLNHFPDCYALYYDVDAGYNGIAGEDSNDVRLSSIPKGENAVTIMCYNKNAYSTHCRDYKSYLTWLEERNENRYVNVGGTEQKYDGKNLLHCRRLLDTAIEIAKTGTLMVRRPNASDLLKIRRGEVNLEELITKAEEDIKELDTLYGKSSLPASVNEELVKQILLEVREAVVF